jgi:hypothetical protein
MVMNSLITTVMQIYTCSGNIKSALSPRRPKIKIGTILLFFPLSSIAAPPPIRTMLAKFAHGEQLGLDELVRAWARICCS